mmetsp:Transcript_44760/g.173670  ORF Transcript_44760/g.173670 Transcript_44760/m.173670 type:complete len:98 (+) Transcript_44760:1113-1406(+)
MDVLHYSISASMGLGGYLSGKTEVDHYKTEKKREEYEVKHQEDDEVEETLEIFREYGLSDDQIAPICEHFKQNHVICCPSYLMDALALAILETIAGP